MKRSVVVPACTALLLSGCVQTLLRAPSFAVAPDPPEGQGIVYIYRVGALPLLRGPEVEIDGGLIISPSEYAYTWVHLPVGRHEMKIDWDWDTGWPDLDFSIDVEAGVPLFIKVTGAYRPVAGGRDMVTKALSVRPAEAVPELTECCSYVPPKTRKEKIGQSAAAAGVPMHPAPAISGTLLRGESPIVNAQVEACFIAESGQCAGTGTRTSTDSSGRFDFPRGSWGQTPGYQMFGPGWRLSVIGPDKPQILYSGPLIGQPRNLLVDIRCDLASKPGEECGIAWAEAP